MTEEELRASYADMSPDERDEVLRLNCESTENGLGWVQLLIDLGADNDKMNNPAS